MIYCPSEWFFSPAVAGRAAGIPAAEAAGTRAPSAGSGRAGPPASSGP